ncbi:signal recognition particle, SRP9/SRP14 subunit [Globomyces pollinis-pini]|nr:signal recognition particle, SRP9/SRP14 subunit [Globomyces pollinis-pini]
MLVDNEKFFVRLDELFLSQKDKGSISITMKRFCYPQLKQAKKEKVELPVDIEYPCLLRVAAGQYKLSTLVESKDLLEFNQKYFNVARNHMVALKKKDKKKKKDTK